METVKRSMVVRVRGEGRMNRSAESLRRMKLFSMIM